MEPGLSYNLGSEAEIADLFCILADAFVAEDKKNTFHGL